MKHSVERQPHVDKNMSLRALKARKIEALLGLDRNKICGSMLEVGTGSGGIAHYFARNASSRWVVSTVDVVDSRQLKDGYCFKLIEGCELPFDDESFDAVISNHVIEHVGDESSQLLHLKELRRVMKPGATGYLAVPNRWMLVEPHYGLAFLSWLPNRWRSTYLRISGKGNVYDCEPLALRPLEKLLDVADLSYRNLCVEAMRVTLEIERPQSLLLRTLRFLPSSVLSLFRRVIPTLIYEIRRPELDDSIKRGSL